MDRNTTGIQPGKQQIVSPDPLLQFVFAMFALLTALSVLVKLSPDARFVMGVLQMALGLAAFTGSILNLIKGDPHGNINLILSVILGFAGGITQIASVVALMHNWHFHPWIMSVILLMGGLYMLCFLPLLNEKPLYQWISHLFVASGFLCSAIADLCSIPVLKIVSAWFLIVFSLTSLYGGVSMMYQETGHRLPQGISLKQLTAGRK